MCSDFLAENTKRAAAFKTDCSRCKSAIEEIKIELEKYNTIVIRKHTDKQLER